MLPRPGDILPESLWREGSPGPPAGPAQELATIVRLVDAACNMTIYMDIFLIMTKINIAEAKASLSRYLKRVEAGETILLCRRNVPIAEIRPLPAARTRLRPIGVDRGMNVPESFFEPLPDELLRAFGTLDP